MSKKKDPMYDVKPIEQLDDKRAYTRVMSDYNQAVQHKSDSLERYERYTAIYKTMDPPSEKVDETTGLVDADEAIYANTYLAIGAAVVDSAVAHFFNMIFSTDDYLRIEADDFEDGFFATQITAHLKRRHHQMGYKSTIYTALQQACIFDYAITGTRWLLEGGYVPKKTEVTKKVNFGGVVVDKREVKIEMVHVPDKIDRSDLFVLPHDRCYHDWTSKDGFKGSRFFCDDRDVKLETLLAESKQAVPHGKYKNIDKVLSAVTLNIKSELENIDDAEVMREYVHSRRVKVIRYTTQNHMVEVAQGHVIRRMHLNGWPFQCWTPTPLPGEFGGMGLLQRLERNQYDINASMNSRRNLQNLISQPFAVLDQELLQGQEGPPRIYPGWVGVSKRGNVKDKIHVYTPGANSNQDAMGDVKVQVDMAYKQSGITDSAQGAVTSGRTTATEISKATAGADTRMITVVRRWEEECIEVINLNLFMLEQQNLTKTEMINNAGLHGDQMMEIGPHTYMWNSIPRFQAKGTIHISEDLVQTQQFMAAVDKAMAMPMVKHNWDNIAVEMWRRLNPRDYQKFVKDPTIPDHNIPPDVENMMLAQGRRVEVSPSNDNQEHLQSHIALKQTPDYQLWPESFKMNLEQHLQEHQANNVVPNQQSTPPMQDMADPMRGMRGASMGGLQ